MISKRIRMADAGKSSIVRLVGYITSDQKKDHRISQVIVTNCEYSDPNLAAREMLLTQLRNTRARSDKTYHLMVSFRPGEEPTPETIRRVETEMCKRLGYAEHQRVAVVHRDTDSVHLHIAINKIHPRRFRIHDPYMDYRALAQVCGKLEKELHLRPDNHEPTGRTETERKAGDIEAKTGEQSLLSWIREECLPALKAANSWEEFHRELAKAGLIVKVQNNGFNFVAATGERVKGSGVDRSFSKASLEKRFGPFKAAPQECKNAKPEKTYERKPLGPANPLKEEYAQAKARHDSAREAEFAAIRDRHRRKVAALTAEIRLDRHRARRIPAKRPAKRRLYAAIDAKFQREMARIREETRRERTRLYEETPKCDWLSWLQDQAKGGREDALKALRGRAFGLAKHAGIAVRGERDAPDGFLPDEKVDAVTKRGTVIYSFGSDALRDDGEAFRMTRTAGIDTAVMALKIAKQRFGEPLRVSGDKEFRDLVVKAAVEGRVHVAFADPALENRRKQLMFRTAKTNQTAKEKEYER